MKTNVLTLVITLVLGVILAGSLLAPVVSEAQNTMTAVTYTNEGYMDMDKMSYLDADYTLEYNNNVVTVTTGGKSFNIDGANFSFDPRVMLFDQGRIGITHGTGTITNVGYVDIFDETNANHAIKTGGTVTYTHADQTLTIVTQPGATAITYQITHAIGAVENGQYVQIAANGFNQRYYTESLAESGKLGYFWGAITYNSATYHVTISEGEIYSPQLDAAGIEWTGSITIGGSPTLVEGTTDIYTGGVPACTITIGGSEYNTNVIYAAILKDIPGHEVSSTSSLLGVIPILVIVAILMTAVGAIALRRND